jgi:hypothetical protein
MRKALCSNLGCLVTSFTIHNTFSPRFLSLVSYM